MPNARQYLQTAAASVPGVDHGPPFSLRSRESSRPRLLCCLTLDLLELDLYIDIDSLTQRRAQMDSKLFIEKSLNMVYYKLEGDNS